MSKTISRRTVLRGLGVAMGLPVLDAMAPAFASTRASVPLRLGVVFFPNGVDMKKWLPAATGADYALSPTLAPLEPHREDFLVLSGLTHDKARANGDGPGDHARSSATFLTGSQARKTDGKEIRAGISLDQLAASKLGTATKLPSLEIGCEKGAMAGNCDSGYSCAYSSTISWKSPTLPLPKEVNPRSIFTRLFGDPRQVLEERDRARQAMIRRSILDLVRDDARALHGGLGRADQGKLDEYLEAVRSIEQRIQTVEKDPTRKLPALEAPAGVPAEFPDYIRLMMDLMVAAFQTDSTRVASFVLSNEGSNRTFPWLDVREGHHSISHHSGNPEKLAMIQKIDKFYVEQFAYLIQRMKSIREGDGTLLDRSMLLYGCAIGDGNRHNHDDLPVLLAGRGGGSIKPGRHVRHPKNTPMCNLYLSMLDRLGVNEERFGDSKGRLSDL